MGIVAGKDACYIFEDGVKLEIKSELLVTS
jgi:hypothetical protein